MTKSKNIWIKELIFQTILIFTVFLFYSFDKHDPLIEFHEIIFFSNYLIAALIINYIFLQKFLYQKKYLFFFLGFGLLVSSVILFEELVLEKIFYPDTRGKKIPNVIYNLLQVLPPVIILAGFKLAWDTVNKQKELDEIKIIAKESELQFLKSQINPHFLFNNMNNLYAHAIEKSSKTPKIILALSDILRYMLYDCKSKFVALDKEIDQLKNFIGLNEMQIEGRGSVKFLHNNESHGYRIAPLLLMVFIENAFKHSSSSQTAHINIDIELSVNKHGQLNFVCKNTFQSQSNTANLSKGIGLKNVKKRLDLIYPDKHQLNISDLDGTFEVHLNIELNNFMD